MSTISASIDPMRSMPWPMAIVVSVAIVVVGVLAFMDKDVDAVMNAIIFLLMALGYAELREIKSQTNGSNTKLMEELAEYRRSQTRTIDRAMESSGQAPDHP